MTPERVRELLTARTSDYAASVNAGFACVLPLSQIEAIIMEACAEERRAALDEAIELCRAKAKYGPMTIEEFAACYINPD